MYSPGVQFNASPIFQGLAGGASDLARAMVDKKEKEEENKDFIAKSRATEAFLKANGEAIDLDGEQVKALLAPQPDESPRARAIRLGATLANGFTGATLKRQQAAEKQQQEQAVLQAKLNKAHLAQLDRAAAQADNNSGALRQAMKVTADGGDGVGLYAQMGGNDAQEMNILASRMKPTKPMPGSKGFGVEDIPGMGKLARDLATGDAVDSSKIVKPVAPKSSSAGVEYSPDKQFYRSSDADDWHPVADKKNDSKALTTQEIQRFEAMNKTERDVDALAKAFDDIGDADWGGPIASRLRRAISGGGLGIIGKQSAGVDANISKIDNLITLAVGNLAKGEGKEVGALTDADIDRYVRTLPSPEDTAVQRQEKIKTLRASIKASRSGALDTYRAAGRDVTGLEKLYGGAAPENSANPTSALTPEAARAELARRRAGQK